MDVIALTSSEPWNARCFSNSDLGVCQTHGRCSSPTPLSTVCHVRRSTISAKILARVLHVNKYENLYASIPDCLSEDNATVFAFSAESAQKELLIRKKRRVCFSRGRALSLTAAQRCQETPDTRGSCLPTIHPDVKLKTQKSRRLAMAFHSAIGRDPVHGSQVSGTCILRSHPCLKRSEKSTKREHNI
jgi:hypothetical protein